MDLTKLVGPWLDMCCGKVGAQQSDLYLRSVLRIAAADQKLGSRRKCVSFVKNKPFEPI